MEKKTDTKIELMNYILKCLGFGPVEKKMISKLLKIEEDRRNFDRLLKKMVELQYISIREYPNPYTGKGNIKILLLREAGANKLANITGLERGFIRTPVPQKGHLEHELALTKMFCRIYEDIAKGFIEVHSFKDDAALRRDFINQKDKIEKGIYFPDFELKTRQKDLDLNVLLEFDHGQKNRDYWTKKVLCFSKQTADYMPKAIIMVATNPDRLEKLKEYTLMTNRAGRNCYIFITFDGFLSRGLASIIKFIKENPSVAIYNQHTGEYYEKL